MIAKDIMTSPVVAARPETDVVEIAKLMLGCHISGVPVVDDDERVLGVVSEGDLVRRVEAGTAETRHSWWLGLIADPADEARAYIKSHGRKAKDVMTSPAIVVDAEAPLAVIAETLEKNHIKRVPVVRGGQLVGIVSRANIVQLVASARRMEIPVKASDAEIRAAVFETLKKQPWATLGSSNVTVQSGVVELWGFHDTEEERNATRVAIEGIPGVKGVEDHRAQRTVLFSGAY